MKAIILARVSTEEQKEIGNSLPAQIERLKNYCKNKNLEIVKVFSFDESAYKTKRDDFDKALEYLKTSKEKIVICFDKVDRFSRNVFDKRVSLLHELAMKDKTELHFASDNLIIGPNVSATEKFHFGINLGLAKYFSDAISDSVKRANEEKIRAGEITRRAPIGYFNIREEKENKGGVVVDKIRANFILKIFKLYSTGNYSMKTLSKIMQKEGFKTRKGGEIGTRHIELILKNPFYYGFQNYKGELYPHKYEPIISYDLFLMCQKVKEGYKKVRKKMSGKPFIFKGLITCNKCGCRITSEFKKNRYVYYHCTDHKEICEKIFVKEEEILKPIEEVLSKLVLPQNKINEITGSLKATEDSKNKFQEEQLKQIRKEYDLIESRISKMYEDRLDGRITIDMYDNLIKDYKEKQQELLFKMKQLDNADKNYYITANTILSLAQRAHQLFKSSEIEEKRQIINFVFQNLRLDGKNLLFETKTPFN